MTLTYSQIQTWLDCRRLYKFRYVDLLAPVSESPALRLGSAIHYGLEWHHGSDSGVEAIERFYDRNPAIVIDDDAIVHELGNEQNIAIAMMEGYK
jgi:hypothetical protein